MAKFLKVENGWTVQFVNVNNISHVKANPKDGVCITFNKDAEVRARGHRVLSMNVSDSKQSQAIIKQMRKLK